MLEDKSYRNIAKSTVLFGGVKVVEIVVSIVRIKIVALLLGPQGMGIQALFASTLSTVAQLSSLGIFQSSVRDISLAYENKDKKQISKIIQIVDGWVWIVAIIGVLFCLIGARYLSLLVFNSTEYSWQFVMLSLAIFFWSISNGNITIMQGCRQLVPLAKSSLIGAVVGLLITIPIYYWFGIVGIVPALVSSYFSIYLVNYYFARRFKKKYRSQISLLEIWSGGKGIVKLGIVLMFSNLLMTMFGLFTNSYISNLGGVKDVGLFQASFTITIGNLSVILAVLASDFYPRLSAICEDVFKVNSLVNQQVELLLLFISPMSIALILFSPLAVNILYSSEFYSIIPMLRWMSIALIFRVVWHSFSYVILAKGDRRTFLIYDAFIGNGLNFVFNIISYYFWGLAGLGISFVVGAVSMSVILYGVIYFKYGFRVEKVLGILFMQFFILIILCFGSILFLDGIYVYLINIIIVILLLSILLKRINRKMNLKEYICSKKIFSDKK